jgi:hypothetical protein
VTHVELWHSIDADDATESLESCAHGLGADEAAHRLDEHGLNQLEGGEGPGKLTILVNQSRSPLISVLLIAGIVATGLPRRSP